MMKRLFLIAIIFLQWAFGLDALAAPPLRGLMPMKLADGTTVVPTGESRAALTEMNCCASAAMIGEGNYLQHTGNVRVLTILAAFQDVGFTVNEPVKAFEHMLMHPEFKEATSKHDYYYGYMAKNTYWFSCWETLNFFQEDRQETKDKDSEVHRFIVIVPENFDPFYYSDSKNIITTDPSRFWASPQ